ncbi:MAG: hypothetical protein ACI8T1_005199 [Verrucomicrobiales bacterium]|jgi:hypothetical protein
MGRPSQQPFLKSVTRKALPSNVPYHLLFGYKNTSTLPSQLVSRVQDAAARVYGFNTDERGIIADRAAAQHINRALSASRR